jgi:hypothetical protein
MSRTRWCLALFAVLTMSSFALAQRRDPLTDKEVDALRETAQEPNKRVHLMVTYAKARMEAIEHLRSDQNMAAVQGEQVSNLLSDLAAIVDEIDDNLESYDSRGEDIRKALREVIEANTDFQLKLRAIKDTTPPAQKKEFSFAVENATESVNSSADSARAMLDSENAKKGKEKVDKSDKDKDEQASKDKPAKQKKQKPDYTGMGLPKPD